MWGVGCSDVVRVEEGEVVGIVEVVLTAARVAAIVPVVVPEIGRCWQGRS